MRYEAQPLTEGRKKISSYGKRTKNFTKHASREEMITSVWEQWCILTRRPESHSVLDDEIRTELESNLSQWLTQSLSVVQYFVRAAVYLSPVKGDSNDTERLFTCLTNKSVRKYAVDCMSSVAALPYYWSSPDDTSHRIDEIISIIGCNPFSEQPDKEQNSMVSLAAMTHHDFDVLYNRALRVYDDDHDLTPSDILTVGQRGSIKVKVKKRNTGYGDSEDSYNAGRSEDDNLFGDDSIEYDTYAMELVMSGYDMKSIIDYHNAMPRGYWREVAQIVEQYARTDMENIYNELQGKYRMHPSERRTPDLL